MKNTAFNRGSADWRSSKWVRELRIAVMYEGTLNESIGPWNGMLMYVPCV